MGWAKTEEEQNTSVEVQPAWPASTVPCFPSLKTLTSNLPSAGPRLAPRTACTNQTVYGQCEGR